jgi:hypothetical protein
MSKLIFFALMFAISVSFAKTNKTITCDEATPQIVTVPVGRVTVLNFPTSPKEIVPGEAGFDFKTIRQDLVLKVMKLGAKTNLFVYLEARRCFFHLVSSSSGDEILFVRDPKEKNLEVKFVKE